MNATHHTLLLAGFLALSTTPVLADGVDDALGFTPSAASAPAVAATPPAPAVEAAVPAPAVETPTAPDTAATPAMFDANGKAVAPAAEVATPAAPAMFDANGKPVAPAAEAAAPAAPEVPQLSQAEKDSQFWLAAKNGDLATVSSLLEQGANPNTTNDNGATAIHAATAAGSLQLVMFLQKSGTDIHTKTTKGWTALHTAARFGKADIANYLKQQGLDPNLPTTESPNKTPMQMALDKGDLRIARLLGY